MSLSYRQAVSVLFPALIGANLLDSDTPDPDWTFALVPSNFDLDEDEWSIEDWSVVWEVLQGFFDDDLENEADVRVLMAGASATGDAQVASLVSANIALFVEIRSTYTSKQVDYYLARADRLDIPA